MVEDGESTEIHLNNDDKKDDVDLTPQGPELRNKVESVQRSQKCQRRGGEFINELLKRVRRGERPT